MTTNPLKNQRRLVLTVYRSLMRWCKEIPPDIPLDEFIPPMRGRIMDNVEVFRTVLRESFREELPAGMPLRDRVQGGISGLRQLNQARPDIEAYSRQWGESIRKMQRKKSNTTDKNTDSLGTGTTDIMAVESVWVREQLERVSWLPKLEDCDPMSLQVEESTKFPLFPLNGPLFHQDSITASDPDSTTLLETIPLPLFTPRQDIPIPEMEVPLQIFEPRYRQLYNDLSVSESPRNLVVPFAHPLIPGQFASFAMVYKLTKLREIADETNGRVQFLADHVVTQPIHIQAILNPQVWATKETYLQIQGHLVEDDSTNNNGADVYDPLKTVLQSWKDDTSHPLATKSLAALDATSSDAGIWALVHVWNLHFQQELLQLQLGVYTQVKRQAALRSHFDGGYTQQQVSEAQKPHRRRLLQLMLDTSLLVPTLLALDEEGKCQHLMDMVHRERRFLKTNSF